MILKCIQNMTVNKEAEYFLSLNNNKSLKQNLGIICNLHKVSLLEGIHCPQKLFSFLIW